ncbi:hypothetical protein SR42_00705 [Clostridium botulinum]|uniref:hypothetical protein n=1 Tax=Clostridium botulinum TaxID=1491 RepID=UPI000596E2F9|nr:hypothetical protein [Clostridium botulinum]KIL07600.1 hypothetical protein SR42_00705 [Clostridium botulinum]MBY6934086.1 hypothetical protein [Clostridium botulinum]NFL83111.1 hypothetical protein [Clostridium botulinum]NFN10008.1 hypothetical protein [Clostridium botulinum]NFO35174.1 hypothetical protein [Clostridium botulinum]
MNKLTVNEIIKNEGVMLHKNKINLIVAPAGSGKTYYIFNTLLNPLEKSVYLCDTSNLYKCQPMNVSFRSFKNVVF